MATAEGTIQFAYDLHPLEDEVLVSEPIFRQLHAWRTLLKRLDLLGHDPDRYGGFGYGNISGREAEAASGFLITASQTSGKVKFRPRDLVQVSGYNLERFWVDANGSQPPSSETLTHAMVYAADPRINYVFHIHSPELWRHAANLGIPTTPEQVDYGSLAMVSAVADLLTDFQSRPLIFATLGHEDGVFACGHNPQDTGGLLVSHLAKALEIDAQS